MRINPDEYHPFPWYWEAIYDTYNPLQENKDTVDSLSEIAPDGSLRYFKDIDQSRLTGFILRPKEVTHPQFAVHLGEGRRLIFFRRRSRVLDMSTGNQQDGVTWHVIGYQITENNTNVKSFQFIAEDGTSFITNDDQAV